MLFLNNSEDFGKLVDDDYVSELERVVELIQRTQTVYHESVQSKAILQNV